MEPNPSVPAATFAAAGDSTGDGALLATPNGTSTPGAPPSQIDAQMSEATLSPSVESSTQLESAFGETAEMEPSAERAKRKREAPFPACDSFMGCPEGANTVDIEFSSLSKRQKVQSPTFPQRSRFCPFCLAGRNHSFLEPQFIIMSLDQ